MVDTKELALENCLKNMGSPFSCSRREVPLIEIVHGISEPGIAGQLKRIAFLDTRKNLVKVHFMKDFNSNIFTQNQVREKWKKYARMARKYESQKASLIKNEEKEMITSSNFFWMTYVTRNLYKKWKQERFRILYFSIFLLFF
jgi:hypothetical protein